jgi:hypothetical protein
MAQAPTTFCYFCSDFFSPYFFPSYSRVSTPGGDQPTLYFAPTYFSPFYYPPLTTLATVGTPVAASDYRDRHAFDAAVALLKVTGEFADVTFGTTPDGRRTAADSTPVAVITPCSWWESEDADPTLVIRSVSFTVSLIVRSDDVDSGFAELDRLSCVVMNALDGSSLAGGCLLALTRVRLGTYDASSPYPELVVTLQCECVYLIQSPTAHDISS